MIEPVTAIASAASTAVKLVATARNLKPSANLAQGEALLETALDRTRMLQVVKSPLVPTDTLTILEQSCLDAQTEADRLAHSFDFVHEAQELDRASRSSSNKVKSNQIQLGRTANNTTEVNEPGITTNVKATSPTVKEPDDTDLKVSETRVKELETTEATGADVHEPAPDHLITQDSRAVTSGLTSKP
ncbi:hypothetical protein NLI96_g11176 [Meripilus lineatus]|uniref:Uncharacterized protein n=1 Tax=Meripilus lineatus TaxID=2056292 RepID=A0AAD5YB95_9APHY|nr:hypothetical protein NLI96_g11176 [Physisporinus lineatus]